jgi:hypothetical protein
VGRKVGGAARGRGNPKYLPVLIGEGRHANKGSGYAIRKEGRGGEKGKQ